MHSVDPRRRVSDVTMVVYNRDALYIIYSSPVKFELKLCIRSSSNTGPDHVGENCYIVVTHSQYIYRPSTYVSMTRQIQLQCRERAIEYSAYYYY